MGWRNDTNDSDTRDASDTSNATDTSVLLRATGRDKVMPDHYSTILKLTFAQISSLFLTQVVFSP